MFRWNMAISLKHADVNTMRVRFRRGTHTQLMETNPVLKKYEPMIDTTFLSLKVGDGRTPWVLLREVSLEEMLQLMVED